MSIKINLVIRSGFEKTNLDLFLSLEIHLIYIYDKIKKRGDNMKRIYQILFIAFMCLLMTSCKKTNQFNIEFSEGTYTGRNEKYDVMIELSQVSIMEYVKSDYNLVKDLATIDDESYVPYDIIFAIEYNYELYHISLEKSNTQTNKNCYEIKCLNNQLSLNSITLKLIDQDNNKFSEKIELSLEFESNSSSIVLLYDEYHITNPLYAKTRNFTLKNNMIETSSNIIDLDDIVYDGSLQQLFDCSFDDTYLKENYFAFAFTRIEPFYMINTNTSYKDLFLENGRLYISQVYDKDVPEIIPYIYQPDLEFKELFLIPKSWQGMLRRTNNYQLLINKIYPNSEEIVLTHDVLDNIKKSYMRDMKTLMLPSNIQVLGLTQTNKTAIFMLTCDLFDYPAYIEEQTYGEYVFYYSAAYSLLVYHGSRTYLVQEALEQNLITMDDIAKAYYQYEKK